MRVSTLFRTAVMTDSSRAPATLSLSRLLLLDAVWRLRSLSDAAKECGLSVSTASRQLSQARKDFGDELFIRSGYELYPTDRMNALSNELEPLLARLSGLMRPEEFDPATLRKTFRVMTADNGFMAFIAPSLRLLQEQAPRVSLDIVLPQPESIERMLKDGSIDLAITPIPQNAADLESLPLARIRKCLLMRKGHPLAKELLEHGLESLTPEKIAKWPQAFTNLVKVPEEKSIVNPPSVLRVPYFNSIAFALPDTDYIDWIPESAANYWENFPGLISFPLPEDISPAFTPRLIWSARSTHNPEHVWLRSLIISRARELYEAPDTPAKNP